MYVEAFLTPVKTARLADYRTLAEKAGPMWQAMGALSVVECMAENAPAGEVTSFPRAVQLQEDETVFLSFVTFRDRAHRDAVMAEAEANAEFMGLMDFSLMDGRRMVWGGFEAVHALGPVTGG